MTDTILVGVKDALTDAVIASQIRRAQLEAGEILVACRPDLRLRIRSGTAEWFALVDNESAASRWASIGTWPILSPEGALAWEVNDTKNRKSMTTGTFALGDLIETYNARRLVHLRTGKYVYNAIIRSLSDYLHVDPRSITRRDLADIFDAYATHAPFSANRNLSAIKTFFTWAEGRGFIDNNPARGIPPPIRERSRDRTPSLAELARIWQVCDRLSYPFGWAIQLIMLTGARRQEIGALKWSDVDWGLDGEPASWSLPAERSKNGCGFRSPLSPAALRILKRSKKAQPGPSPYVFTTARCTNPIGGWSKVKSRIDGLLAQDTSAQAIAPWRIHDFRRSFATIACDRLRIDPAVADRCLNHVGSATSSAISRVYQRGEMFEQRSKALRRWAKLLLKHVEPS